MLHERGRDRVDRVLLLAHQALRFFEELLKEVVDQHKHCVRVTADRTRRRDHQRRAHAEPRHVGERGIGRVLEVAARSLEFGAEKELFDGAGHGNDCA